MVIAVAALIGPAESRAGEPLIVVTTLPDIAELVRTIGGPEVSVTSLLTGAEDPHFVDATPTAVARVAKADVVCAIGFDLETGWLPKVLSKSGNARVQPGGPGYCELGSTVEPLEKPTGPIDRSMGDIHAHGNPHFNLSPRSMADASRSVLKVLSAARPDKAADFTTRQNGFTASMKSLEDQVRTLLKPAIDLSLKGTPIIEYHREFTYFFALYGLRSMGSIEEKPGLTPSAARMAQVALAAKSAGVRVALSSHVNPVKQLARFSELSGVKTVTVYTSVQAGGKTLPNSIEAVQLAIANAIVTGIQP